MMENKRVFIGNLNFEVTDEEIENLLAKYGSVVNIKLYKKKGYAFVEMGNAAEAARAVQKLDGVKYGDREIRISLEMKASKAKSLTIKRRKERSESFSRQGSGGNSDTKSRSEKYRDSVKYKSTSGSGTKKRISGIENSSAEDYGKKKIRL